MIKRETMLFVFPAFFCRFIGIGKTILEHKVKAGWILLIGFISVEYTNILQSIVVAPSAHCTVINVEDMLEDNFSFQIIPEALGWIKNEESWGNNLVHRSESKTAEKEMGEIEIGFAFRMEGFTEESLGGWSGIIRHFSEDQRFDQR